MSGSPQNAANPAAEAPPAGAQPVLRVCQFASGDLWAGAEVQIATLLRELSRRPGLQLSAVFLNEGRLAQEARDCSVEVMVIPEDRHGFLGIATRAAAWLRDRGVHILHSHRYKENLLAAMVAKRCGIPFLVRSQHGLPEPVPAHKNLKHAALRFLDGLVARYRTDRVISVSREMEHYLMRRTARGKIALIYNGIDTERVRSGLTPAEAKSRLGWSADTPVIGTAGRLVPIKRLDLFLKAGKELARQWPEARFLIVGDGRERERLQALAQALGIAERVRFTGHRENVHDLMRAMDIFTLTSDHEGLPMALLEAMALGTPVVARKVGGMAEVVAEGAGILVDSAAPEAIAAGFERLLADEAARQRCGMQAAAHVRQHFSSAQTAERVVDLYRSLRRA